MTPAQFELALLIVKGMMNLAQHLDKVGDMTDDECRAAIPLVQSTIDSNDKIIQEL